MFLYKTTWASRHFFVLKFRMIWTLAMNGFMVQNVQNRTHSKSELKNVPILNGIWFSGLGFRASTVFSFTLVSMLPNVKQRFEILVK